MKRLILSCLGLSIVLMSCQDKEIKKHIETVKQLQTQVDDIEKIMETVKDDSNGHMVTTVRMDISNIKHNYVGPDTTNIELGSMLTDYKSIRKVFGTTAKSKRIVTNSIPEERQQLENLLHDLESGSNDREKYTEFVLTEQRNVAQMDTMSRVYKQTVEEYKELFYTLKPKVDSFLGTILPK